MKNLDSIFKNFKKTLNDLDRFAMESDKIIETNRKRVAKIQEDNARVIHDRNRADKAASQVAKMIGEADE